MRFQMPTLLHFAQYINSFPQSRALHLPPPCQPPLSPPHPRPVRNTNESGSHGLLLAAFEVGDLRQELLAVMSLSSKRAAAAVCSSLCAILSAHLHAPELWVRIEDATFDNAAYVGRLPNLQRLHVQGEVSQPNGMDLAKLRRTERINISELGFEAALFLGAALSGGDHSLRLSRNSSILLPPLRTNERINLFGRGLQDADLAALLGALSLNQTLKEFNINSNPAPVSNGLRAAMVQALPWQVLRNQGGIKIAALLHSVKVGEQRRL